MRVKWWFLSLWVCVLCGCSVLPHKRTTSQSVKTAEAVQTANRETLRTLTTRPPVIAPEPQPIRVGGIGNRVTIPPQQPAAPAAVVTAPAGPFRPHYLEPEREELEYSSEAATDAQTKETARGWFKFTLPLGVSLLLAAAGIVAVLFALRLVKRHSAAAAVAFDAADQALAAGIRKARDLAQHELIGDLEAERGKLVRKK